MTNLAKIFFSVATAAAFTACKKDEDPVIIVTAQPSAGTERVEFDGNVGTQTGSTAGNSVYLDFSTDKTTPVLRSSWDLGFYSSADYTVELNNFSSAGVKVTNKFDLNAITTADTTGLTLAPSQTNPQISDLAYFDNANGDISMTAIPAISATDAANPVLILNRGTGGGIASKPWLKVRILRAANGYTVQYATLQETTMHTYTVNKNDAFNFTFLSFDNGIVSAEPEKAKWDLVWSYSVYQANFGNGFVPYNFSDLIAVNHLAGVQVKEKIYTDAATANAAYSAFNRDSVNATTVVSGRWTIGSYWRSTQPATGARLERFYLVKDANGNYYKFKCLAMGVGSDGGTRGKPEFKYSLIP